MYFIMSRLLNPIVYFNRKRLFLVGAGSVLLNIILGYNLGFKMLSVSKFVDSSSTFTQHSLTTLFAYLIAFLLFYILGYLFNAGIKWIDIANIVMVSVIPLIFMTLITFIPYFKTALDTLIHTRPVDVEQSVLTPIIIMSIVILPLLVYSILILYKGFKTITHIRSWWEIGLFILTYLLAGTLPQFVF